MEGRTLDKRKARDKETDSEASDTSVNKNPTKRPRVDYSPKEKSPSPAAAQKSPMGKSSLADPFAAATPATSLNSNKSENNNGDASMAESPSALHDNAASSPPVISKFDLPPPFTTQELEQKIGKSADGNGDSDSDNGSTKFLSSIIQSEENKKKRQVKARNSSTSDTGIRSNGTSPMPSSKKSAGTSTTKLVGSVGKSSVHQPSMTSSPVTDLVMDNCELEVTIKIRDPSTHEVILEETVIKSDTERMDAFLRQHNMKLSAPSHTLSSGYLGDTENTNSTKSSGSNRWTISSLGSTIPRHSIVSIATDASESPDELMRRPGRPAPVSKARKRSDGPIMSSTKMDDSSRSSSDALERLNISPNPMSNGEDSHSSSSGKSQPQTSSQPKKNKSTTKLLDIDEGIGASPGSSIASPRKGIKATPKSSLSLPSTSNDSGRSSAKKPAARGRVGSANNFPITHAQTPPGLSAVLSTPPPARSVATIEGTRAKPLSKFEQDMNNEPVIESELQKSETLWSTILPSELVFARWRDKNYYSGMIQSKSLNDTWLIDFDDGMKDVASESHIIPVRILGVGVNGIYTPDDHYEPKQAVIIGQKFQIDADAGGTAVKYAIKCDKDAKPIWCSRRQLSIKESDAKKLRPEYAPIAPGKPAEISIDNIVSGPRRRTRGETASEGPSQKRVVGGAFDASTADEKLLESSTPTPKPRGTPKGGKKTPATDSKKKRSSNASVSTPQTKDASTSSPVKETPAKDPIIRTPKSTAVEPAKKKTKKTLFQGIQFFLTASGGGDPGISGNPITPPIPYDKDEYRELIESCGGEILDTVGNEEKTMVFLISDSYARTVKYIYCLAAGIPCVSHCWIKQCLDNQDIVDWTVFTLPAGWSLEHQDLIQHHVRKPLKDCKIFVTSESDQLYNYWKPVLTAAEAVLLKPSRKKGTIIPPGTEVVVTDHSDTTPDILEEAETLNVPVVKPEWLVQTIITGEKAHLFGHVKYKIVLNDTEESEDFLGESSVDAGANDDVNDVVAQMQSPD